MRVPTIEYGDSKHIKLSASDINYELTGIVFRAEIIPVDKDRKMSVLRDIPHCIFLTFP
jgi:hypothetical protein